MYKLTISDYYQNLGRIWIDKGITWHSILEQTTHLEKGDKTKIVIICNIDIAIKFISMKSFLITRNRSDF